VEEALKQLADPNSCLSKCYGEKADAGLWKEYFKKEVPSLVQDILGRRLGIRGKSGLRPLHPKGPRYPGGAGGGSGGSGRGGGGRGRGNGGPERCTNVGEIDTQGKAREILGELAEQVIPFLEGGNKKLCVYKCPTKGMRMEIIDRSKKCETTMLQY
jgi:hypothetical protein